jgi:hypothetical protein
MSTSTTTVSPERVEALRTWLTRDVHVLAVVGLAAAADMPGRDKAAKKTLVRWLVANAQEMLDESLRHQERVFGPYPW